MKKFSAKSYTRIFSGFTLCVALLWIVTSCDSGLGTTTNTDPTSEEIRLNSSSLTLLVGGTETLNATVLPANLSNKTISWNSSNPQVASVAPNGTITAISVGTATITAKTSGGKTANCAITVTDASTTIEPASITLFPPTLTLDIGGTDTLIVSVTPSNAAKNVNWKSSNPAVVVVEGDGKITAKGAGTAIVYALTVVGGKQASSTITVNAPPVDAEAVKKYEVKSDTSANINDRIKYSVAYGDFNFYYIYLGRMLYVPLFSYAIEEHDGISSTYKISKTDSQTKNIKGIVTQSRQTTLGVVDTNTISTTKGVRLSQEISAKYTTSASAEAFGVKASAGYELAAKVAAEENWSKTVGNSSSSSSSNTTSFADTVEKGTTFTETTLVERTWNFTKSDKPGSYRYTLFSTSDVYLYVILDRNKPNEIYYSFREHVVNNPDFYRWKLDYSEDGTFTKSDETRFGFSASMLDNLPLPKNNIASSFEVTFNSNGGSSVAKQTVQFNSTVTRPANPTRSGYTFDGWYKEAGLQNLYDFSSKVINNITLYAKWSEVIPSYTVTFNVNGGSGTAPAKQTVISGTTITLPGGTGLSRSGYAFVSWNSNSSGTGTIYYPGSSFTVSSNVTLYAKWSVTSYSKKAEDGDFGIKEGGQRDWVITSSFDIAGLKSEGYTKFVFTLKFDTKNNLFINIGSLLYVSFLKGSTTQYVENQYLFEDYNKWHEGNILIKEVNLSDFENQLIIRFRASPHANYTVGTRTITIEAKK